MNWRNWVPILTVAFALSIVGCAQQRMQGAATRKKPADQTPDASQSSAKGSGSSSDQYSYSTGTQPTPDPFLSQYGQGAGYDPNALGNQGQYGYPTNNGGGTGFNPGSIIGLFGGLMSPNGPLSNVFNGSNVGNAGSPAAAGGGCGCG